jgi:ABC-type transporter Mla subunit MlaD
MRPEQEVTDTLREANRHRNASARLSRDFKTHAGLKRELDAVAADLQGRVDRFVRHSAEETHQLSIELNDVRSEMRTLEATVAQLRRACLDSERLCEDAALKRDALISQLARVRNETADLTQRMSSYLAATRVSTAPLEEMLRLQDRELEHLRFAR